MLDDVGLVVLNYFTFDETEEMLISFKKFYPEVRAIIVDNGSPRNIVKRLYRFAESLNNTTVLALEKNVGFASGHNAGINKLREEGYQYICCSNSDVVFTEDNVLEVLKESLIEFNAALAGPRILDQGGDLHKPTLIKPTHAKVKKLYHLHNRTIKYRVQMVFKKYYSAIKHRVFGRPMNYLNSDSCLYENRKIVYMIKGAFLMFGPEFFKYYSGFDPNTFLYGEERILASMLLLKKLKTIFVPDCQLLHKKYGTSNVVFGNKKSVIKQRFKKDSFNYWYRNYYLRRTFS